MNWTTIPTVLEREQVLCHSNNDPSLLSIPHSHTDVFCKSTASHNARSSSSPLSVLVLPLHAEKGTGEDPTSLL